MLESLNKQENSRALCASKVEKNRPSLIWIEYRKFAGKVIAAKCGPSAVLRRSGESLEELEGRAMSRNIGALYGALNRL